MFYLRVKYSFHRKKISLFYPNKFKNIRFTLLSFPTGYEKEIWESLCFTWYIILQWAIFHVSRKTYFYNFSTSFSWFCYIESLFLKSLKSCVAYPNLHSFIQRCLHGVSTYLLFLRICQHSWNYRRGHRHRRKRF
jgi:hypothetical protein